MQKSDDEGAQRGEGGFNPRRAARSRALESDRALNAPPGVRGRVSCACPLIGGRGTYSRKDVRDGHLYERETRHAAPRACACERAVKRMLHVTTDCCTSSEPPPPDRDIAVA